MSSIYGNKYENWTDWKTDPRKQCMIDGHECDISHYYWNLRHPNDKICHGDGMVIHHPNEKHWDNSPENQMKMTRAEHTALHNKGEKNSMFGKKHTPEAIEKIRAASNGENNPMFGKRGDQAPCFGRTGDKHPMWGKQHSPEAIEKISKPVLANFTEYNSRLEAAKALGVTPTTIRYRILTNKPGYKYL